jgi:threonyl-tRNA synthetase
MIHRAILGSLERFIAIITENFAGKWPFWLNPKQVMVIPVAMKYAEYANTVAQRFKDAGMFAEVDESANTLNKMIRNAQIGQWSFVMGMSLFLFLLVSFAFFSSSGSQSWWIVVGQKEMEDEAVNIRNRDDEAQGREETVSVNEAVERLVRLQKSRSSVAKLE